MAEHELNGQIKSASLAQHIVTSENNLKRAADPKIELPTHLLPTTFVLIAAGRHFQSMHPFWNFMYRQNVTQRELNLSQNSRVVTLMLLEPSSLKWLLVNGWHSTSGLNWPF